MRDETTVEIRVTHKAEEVLPRELINECVGDLIDETKEEKINFCPSEIVNIEGYPEFFITYNPREKAAIVFLMSEELAICPNGIATAMGKNIRIKDVVSAQNN